MSSLDILLWSGLVIGLAVGATGQATGFCLTRGLRNRWSGYGDARLAAFLLALAVAVAGTQLLSLLGLVDLRRSLYLAPQFPVLLVPLGGMLFGLGMMLANGCGARALVLLGQGNLRSFVVLLCLGISAYITLTGLLAPVRTALAATGMLPTLSAVDLPPTGRMAIALALILVCLSFAFWRGRLLKHPRDLAGGIIIGLLVVSAWAATGWLAQDAFEPVPVTALSFVAPVGETIQYAMIATGVRPGFGVTLVLGVVLGAWLMAAGRRQLCLEGFSGPRDMLRYLLGGSLMGCGGALAMGCSIGQGLSGMSTLATSSLLASLGIVLGARMGYSWFPPVNRTPAA